MEPQWHRDRIDELKNKSSTLKWKATLILTGYLGLVSLIYLVWYNQNEVKIRLALVFIFVYITHFQIFKGLKRTIKDLIDTNIKITRNFNVLMGRKK